MAAYRVDIDPADPASVDRALRTEWLLTNGLGGFAMGTALGANTRRYHGLLIAATKPPVGRVLVLHSIIEQLVIPREDGSEEIIDLSTQQFVGADGEPFLHPSGRKYLRRFSVTETAARWDWDLGKHRVSRFVEIAHRHNSVRLRYAVEGETTSWRLIVRPMLGGRDFHELNKPGHPSIDELRGAIQAGGITPVALNFAENATRWINDSQTWRNFAYSVDRSRHQDWVEEWWSPYRWEYDSADGSEFEISASAWTHNLKPPAKRRLVPRWREAPQGGNPVNARTSLKEAADQFCVERWNGDELHTSVIAGYPWFADWGRDTMISLPGLMLCTGRFDEARSTLLNFAAHMQRGLIPNCFHDSGSVEHNTVDASLWFVHAVHALETHSPAHRDPKLLVACRDIVAAYEHGTDFGIRMDPQDGLIAAGDASTQLTWMDAKRDGIAFTPRHGKAVEINALWFNALRCLAELTDDEAERSRLNGLADRVAASFRAQFWWPQRGCLHDVLAPLESGAGYAASGGQLRPNQIFAVSLPFSPLTKDQQRAVVKVVGERLLTPFGLRTLEREDPAYRGRYDGDMWQRDSSYHQGTVWPWLIGPYCEALLRVNDFSAAAKAEARRVVQPLLDEMSNAEGGRCLGQIAEVYDGDVPHRPSGCPAQAWSVAEVLRVMTMIESEAHVH